MRFGGLLEPPFDVIDEQPHFLRQVPVTRINSPDLAPRSLEPWQYAHQLALIDGIFDQKVGLAHDAQPGNRRCYQRLGAIRVQAAGHAHVMRLPDWNR